MTNRIFEEQYGKKQSANYQKPSLWIRFLQNYSIHRLEAVSGILPKGKLSVLEIGCGDGTFLYENRKKWKSVVGVDIVPSLLQKARQRQYGCPVRFIEKDFGNDPLPFADKTFDVCVSIATLQYVYDIDLLFAEVNRVLKKGGMWIFEIPNIAVFWRRYEFLFGRLPQTSHYTNAWDAGVIHYFTYGDVKKFCGKKGFVVESVKTAGILSAIRSSWPDMLGADLIFTCRKK